MNATSRSTLRVLTRVIPRNTAPRLALLVLLALLVCLALLTAGAYAQTATFTAQELLGKPTDTSVTINIVPASNIQYRYEYGTASGSYAHQTSPVNATGGQPSEVTITGLNPDTLYYYRMVYDADGSVDGRQLRDADRAHASAPRGRRANRSRSPSPPIPTERARTCPNAMTNILNEQPDFDIDLGDTFMIDNTTSQSAVNTAYLSLPEAELLRQDQLLHPDLPVLGQPRKRRGLEPRRHSVQHRPGEHPGSQAVLPHAHERRVLQRQHRSAGGHRRGDLRRPASRGLLRLDLGRCALRGHRPVPVHDEPALRSGGRRGGDRRPADRRPVELDAGAAAVRLAQADPREQPRQDTSSSSPTRW